jgi:nitrogenase molybdenum-iron protein NifN
MARVVASAKPAAMDPLKHSQPLGGALALLGMAGCMPLLHGAQGCSAFAKALLTRHLREPVPLQTTALTEVSAILGSTDSLITALTTITARHNPDIIGVLTTGVTEISGEDLAGALRGYRRDIAPPGGPLVVAASTPDFRGGMSDGWSAVLHALVTAEAGGDGQFAADHGLVAVPAGVSLSAADLDEITELIGAFGLRPLLVPDLSTSVDGHLAPGWTPLTTGGTTVADLRRLPEAGTVLAIGTTAVPAGAALAARSGADWRGYDHCGGLAAADALVAELMARSGRPAPQRVRHWRSRLTDGLLDSHFVLAGTRVALAGEPEPLAATAALLTEVGVEVVAAVSPTTSAVLDRMPCDEGVVGDLVDLEERAAEAGRNWWWRPATRGTSPGGSAPRTWSPVPGLRPARCPTARIERVPGQPAPAVRRGEPAARPPGGRSARRCHARRGYSRRGYSRRGYSRRRGPRRRGPRHRSECDRPSNG